jgi:hypothetical protein
MPAVAVLVEGDGDRHVVSAGVVGAAVDDGDAD